LSFKDRRGKARASGDGTLEGLIPRTFRLSLDLEEFPIIREGTRLARVTANVRLNAEVRDHDVEATARVRGAKVLLEDRETRELQNLDDHPDIEIVTRTPPELTPERPVRFIVHVKLDTPMWITRSDMRLSMTGDVDVRHTWGEEVQLAGLIELARGQVQAYGRRFLIDAGYLRFQAEDDIDPFLDVRASWENPTATVILRVTGRLSRPRITFDSNPRLRQDQIVALLVLGRTEVRDQSERDAADESAIGGTETLLAGIGASVVAEGVRERLSLPILGVEPGEEGLGDARYMAGYQAADRLYVEGSHNPSGNARPGENNTEVRVEYRLTRRWSVEMHGGDQNGGADLLWTYSY
ncbi:MAG: translocation/assembly module TamB, partial [Actinobacteria bacterium]|nr:translocation/assembly module TamB [Actinomycetota bacterium]